MSKEITKAIILQAIQDKLKLRELEPEIFSFSERVVPVYDIEQHLVEDEAAVKTVSVTSSGAAEFFEVPADEKWTLNRYDLVFMGAGALTVAGVYIQRKPNDVSVYMDLTAAQTVSYHVSLPIPAVLHPFDKLLANVDGYTSTQNLRLYIDYTREVLR